MVALLVVLGAYLCGSIPFGLLVGRARGLDVRRFGSGNIGATNVMRATGPFFGILTFVLDSGKAAVGPLAATLLDLAPSWIAVAGLAGMLGHCFSIFMGFAGGKAVAALVGAYLVIDLRVALVAVAVFAVTLLLSRYVAVASMMLALAAAVSASWWHGPGDGRALVALAAAALVAWRHRDNWRRLARGEESRSLTWLERGRHA